MRLSNAKSKPYGLLTLVLVLYESFAWPSNSTADTVCRKPSSIGEKNCNGANACHRLWPSYDPLNTVLLGKLGVVVDKLQIIEQGNAEGQKVCSWNMWKRVDNASSTLGYCWRCVIGLSAELTFCLCICWGGGRCVATRWGGFGASTRS